MPGFLCSSAPHGTKTLTIGHVRHTSVSRPPHVCNLTHSSNVSCTFQPSTTLVNAAPTGSMVALAVPAAAPRSAPRVPPAAAMTTAKVPNLLQDLTPSPSQATNEMRGCLLLVLSPMVPTSQEDGVMFGLNVASMSGIGNEFMFLRWCGVLKAQDRLQCGEKKASKIMRFSSCGIINSSYEIWSSQSTFNVPRNNPISDDPTQLIVMYC